MSERLLFSVIIPTRNRPQSLKICLQSFQELQFTLGKWELIVVDDGGSHSLSGISESDFNSLPLKLLRIDHSGPAHARNSGAAIAKGRYLAFTDDDCLVAKDWLKQFMKKFSEDRWDAIGGKSLNPYPGSSVARAWHTLVDFLYEHFRDGEDNVLQLVSNNMACRRSVFKKLGGFNSSCPFAGGEDTEFSYRLIANGFSQCYLPDAITWHYQPDLSLRAYVQQQFRYGRGYFYASRTKKNLSGHELQQLKAYYRWGYRKSLVHSLAKSRSSPSACLLVLLSQFLMHPLGQFYQLLRHKVMSSHNTY